tara:strand:+ start:299 stop:982 length:684 start_codon:yes stop_codon:yes gene_type:complete
MTEFNSNTPDTVNENTPKKSRTVSTAKIERIREKNNETVDQFLQTLTNFQINRSLSTFGELLTAYASSITPAKSLSKGSKGNLDHATLQYLFDNNMVMDGIVNKIIKSRKFKDEEGSDHIFSVKLEQGPGTIGSIDADLRNLSAVRFSVSGIHIKTIDVTTVEGIPTREGNNPTSGTNTVATEEPVFGATTEPTVSYTENAELESNVTEIYEEVSSCSVDENNDFLF